MTLHAPTAVCAPDNEKYDNGCGASGRARSLGACDRLISRPSKAREISVFLAFPPPCVSAKNF